MTIGTQTLVLATPEQFGVGDGVTTDFTLISEQKVLLSAVVSSLFKDDWQGLRKQYAFPRINYALYSQDFTNIVWLLQGMTASSTSDIAAPDGTFTAQILTDTAANAPHYVQQFVRYNIAPGACSTFSIWMKAVSISSLAQQYVQILLDNNTQSGQNSGCYAVFDLVNGIVSLQGTNIGAAAGATATMTVGANGFYQCSVSGVPDLSSIQRRASVLFSNVPGGVGWYGGYIGTGSNTISAWGAQFEVGDALTSYIPTTFPSFQITDYFYDPDAAGISFSTAPVTGALLSWTGTAVYQPPIWQQATISQYANSSVISQLIQNFNDYLDPTTNIDAFYDDLWNIDTAQGYGLDVWGRILGVGRVLNVASVGYFGFTGTSGRLAASGDAFGDGQSNSGGQPWYAGQATTSNFSLSDESYRVLLLAKALANISNGSIPAINQLLINLFVAPVEGRTGNAFCTDGLNMTMTYTFTVRPVLTAVEVAIIGQSGVLPKPTGVSTSLVQL